MHVTVGTFAATLGTVSTLFLTLLVVIITVVSARMNVLDDKIDRRVGEIKADVVQVYRDLLMLPESRRLHLRRGRSLFFYHDAKRSSRKTGL